MSYKPNQYTGLPDFYEVDTAPVTSVSASDTTLTISPTTGDVLAAVNQAADFNWTGVHNFGLNPVQCVGLSSNGGAGVLDLTTISRLADDNGVTLEGGPVYIKSYEYGGGSGIFTEGSTTTFQHNEDWTTTDFTFMQFGGDPNVNSSGLPLRFGWSNPDTGDGWLIFDDGFFNLQTIRANFSADFVSAVSVYTSITDTYVPYSQSGLLGGVLNFAYSNGLTLTAANAAHIPLTVKGAASHSAELFRAQNSSGSTLASITRSAGGTPSNDYAILKLASAESVSSTFEMYVTEDIYNTSALAAYIVPPINNGRIIFGRSGRVAFSLDFTNVTNFASVPNLQLNGKYVGFDNGTYQRISAGTSGTGTFHHGYWGVEVRANQQGSWVYNTTHYESAGAATLMVVPGLASRVSQITYGLASQTADLSQWKNSAFTILTKIDANGYLGLGMGATTLTALLDISGSTTARSAIRFRSGTAPTTPNDGDMWFDGTDMKLRVAGVTKTFTLV